MMIFKFAKILYSVSKAGIFMWAIVKCRMIYTLLVGELMSLQNMLGIHVDWTALLLDYTNIMEGVVKTGGAIYIVIKVYRIIKNKSNNQKIEP